MRPIHTLSLIALLLIAAPAAAYWDRDVVSLPLPSGPLDIEIIPEGGRALTFERSGGDQYRYQGPTSELVGRPYTIRLRNRSDERIKVVVAVDGVNVYWKTPLRGTADGDVGSILQRGERRELGGFQVDQNTAQRFVFSPSEWSEGSGRTDRRIGVVDVQVYREWQRWREIPAISQEEGKRGAEQPSTQRAPSAAQPPIGTTAGDDFESSVRRVRFVAATPVPEVSAVLVYGRPDSFGGGGQRLGIRGEETAGGIRVVDVLPGTTAADVGLLPGDLIVKVDTTGSPRIWDLQRALDRKRAGDYLFLEIERRYHRLSIKVRLD